jgi:hypothetical protein
VIAPAPNRSARGLPAMLAGSSHRPLSRDAAAAPPLSRGVLALLGAVLAVTVIAVALALTEGDPRLPGALDR